MNDAPTPSFSGSRIFKILLPIVVVLVAGAWAVQNYLPSAAQQELEQREVSRLLGKATVAPEPMQGWADANGDLLADFPADNECIKPQKLVFSYVASEEAGNEADAWKPVLDAITEATGIETAYQHFDATEKQLAEMQAGNLHLIAFSTGAVPMAVTAAGFIPVSTFGNADAAGYTMNLLVRADSNINDPKELKGKKITFVRPNSNSGFKAALIYLMNEQGLLPERDYNYGFSMGHELSVAELLAGKTDCIPIASDLFDRMVARGEVDPAAVRVIYESERFPPVAVGYVCNLTPELREQITKVLTEFDWQGTPMLETYGTQNADRFVPVNYKDDWANIRRIDTAIDEARQKY